MQPFAPPEERGNDPVGLAVATSAWATSGVCVGTSSAQVLGLGATGVVLLALALGGGAVFGVGGTLAHRIERRFARSRTAVMTSQGRLTRPLRAWVLAVPIALIALSVLGLLAAGGAGGASPVYAASMVLAAAGVAATAVPLFTRQAVESAVEAVEQGHLDEGRSRFLAIARSPWFFPSARGLARLHLGLLALLEGDLDEAAEWYRAARHRRVRPFACTGSALVAVLDGRLDDAEAVLRDGGGGGRAAQGESDAVRLLLVLRRDGAHEARILGERLYDADSGALFVGLLAAVRRRTGDLEGAAALVDPDLVAALQAGPGARIDELRAWPMGSEPLHRGVPSTKVGA